jgi:tetratricopeptide (TPR) repeat protein
MTEARVNLSAQLAMAGRTEEAVQAGQEGSVSPLEKARMHFSMGNGLDQQGKYEEAIKEYQEAVRLDEKNRYAWRGLGLALAADGKPQDAVDALEKAKGLKPDDQVTLLVLGDLYLTEIENLEKALENYKGYVKAGGSNPDVPNLIGQIEREIEARKAKGK